MDPAYVVIGVCLLPLYFLPALVANHRGHKNFAALTALNVILGWTLVGWTVALVWALLEGQEGNRGTYARGRKPRGSDYNPFGD